MHKHLLLLLFCFVLILSCKKDPEPPVAQFTFANNNCEGPCEITFINESANADQYGWDFGDGIKSVDKNPRHAYAKGGKYAVTLSAIGKGGSMTFTDTISIKSSKPNADFDIQQLIEGQIKVVSKAESSTTYQWTFGDGGTGTGQTGSYIYKTNGTYTIILTATGPGGQSTATKTVTITSVSKPSADFDVEYRTNGEVRLVSKFGSSTTYQWNFGDGTIGTGLDPYHTYKNNGNYTVTLTATGPGGQSTSSKTIQITNIATTGQGIIYLTKNGLGAVEVYIGGSYEGRITVYYSNSTPDCGDNGNVTITKPAGVYNVTAKAVNGSAQWSGTIIITNGQCKKLGLN